MTTIALIPARGGSKGLPGKNLADFLGQSLIGRAIHTALHCDGIDQVIVSTDDEDIATAAREAGASVPSLRPADLATDDAPMLPVVLHAMGFVPDATVVVLLQPTSPLRSSTDIADALALHRSNGRPVVSVSHAKPWLFKMGDDGGLDALTQIEACRQHAGVVVAPNGAIYIASAESLRAGDTWWNNPLGYLMPAERSVDIDTAHDLTVARVLGLGPPGEFRDERSVTGAVY